MTSPSDFRLTWLWHHAFINELPDITTSEQKFFSDCYLAMREKVAALVAQVALSMPGLTVHDLTHLDALWETASLVSEGNITISPAEAFVFGASVLLHDAAMSLAAYPKGIEQLKETIEWKDTVIALLGDSEYDPESISNPTQSILQLAIPEVLRQLHAQQAEMLAKQGWIAENGDVIYLINDEDVRFFYGETIGQIAHSHWWPISRVERELSENLGAFPGKTKNQIDRIKLACLLRIADALHLDQRRAPRFLRTMTHPQGLSALHWSFQERLAAPHIENDLIVFTAAAPFEVSDADAWWLAYDTISGVNRELQDVDLLLQSRNQSLCLRARRVKGAESPESLARTIHTKGWRPIDTRLRVSDIPKVVETLGGTQLYGDDPTIVLRELIQNSTDAIQARRRYQGRREGWGNIMVSLSEKNDGYWLAIEDNGIGMSERVMTGPLIDFGTSFWRTSLATQEFPGLIAKGMNATGRYGIGFFSVFMLGNIVRVISRRYDQGEETARVLEFRNGTASRPILSPAERGSAPIDGGTRVEIQLKTQPRTTDGLLYVSEKTSLTLLQLVASLAPSIDVAIEVEEDGVSKRATESGDWVKLPSHALLSRLSPLEQFDSQDRERKEGHHAAMRPVLGKNDQLLGRAYIKPGRYFFRNDGGWVTVGGLRAVRLANIQGVLVGETVTASRDSALPVVSKEDLAKWATEQANIISASKSDDAFKANCAEIVLECGGNPAGLPIVCWGQNRWLCAEQFYEQLLNLSEISVYFDGDVSYDEDEDDVHPREFKNEFQINDNVITVPAYDGSILRVGRQSWPKSITNQARHRGSNLAAEVRRLLVKAWGEDPEESFEDREVGLVGRTAIVRPMTVFQRASNAEQYIDE